VPADAAASTALTVRSSEWHRQGPSFYRARKRRLTPRSAWASGSCVNGSFACRFPGQHDSASIGRPTFMPSARIKYSVDAHSSLRCLTYSD
jgi:hypothetical protein